MSSDRMETEQQTAQTTGDFRQQIAALEQSGFKKHKYNYKLLKRTGGNVEVVKAFLEAEDKTRQAQKEERKKRRSDYSSSSSSSSSSEDERKKEKRAKREQKKEEKKKEKVFKKIEKKDWKQYRKNGKNANAHVKTESVDDLPAIVNLNENGWPAEGKNLYLDGNNMLFVLGPIRKLALQGKRAHAEFVLQCLAEEFTKKMGLTKCTLIYDNTKKNVATASFVVCSARPDFATSDDALVAWASEPEGKGLYVTSDRGLIERLAAVGSSICKPKQWFSFVARILSDGGAEDLESWVQAWMDKQEANMNNNAL
mmetsp:Transcript_3338/g.4588  ORF Transcript_3338/g.4588 Transcript_3338/m.4588 type:complete len:311 (+) Transcript_3338:49-981(+)